MGIRINRNPSHCTLLRSRFTSIPRVSCLPTTGRFSSITKTGEQEIDSETGLTVFDFAPSDEISNESGADFILTVSPGELHADYLKDIYVLVNYGVVA